MLPAILTQSTIELEVVAVDAKVGVTVIAVLMSTVLVEVVVVLGTNVQFATLLPAILTQMILGSGDLVTTLMFVVVVVVVVVVISEAVDC